MNAAEVSSIVDRDARTDWWFLAEHGDEFKLGLVTPPEKRSYMFAWKPDKFEEGWLVFEEKPEDKSGYKIVYTEGTHGYFGIASGNSVTGPEVYETPAGFNFVQAFEKMQELITEAVKS